MINSPKMTEKVDEMQGAIFDGDTNKVIELINAGYVPTIKDLGEALGRGWNLCEILIKNYPKISDGQEMCKFIRDLFDATWSSGEIECDDAIYCAISVAECVYSPFQGEISRMFNSNF